MNFKFRRFFSLSISFILGAFFCLIGIVGLILPWSSSLRASLVNLITYHTLILSLFGLGGIFIGLSLVIYTIFNTRGRYAYVRTGNRSITLDENLIENYLQSYWKKKFPHHDAILFNLSIHKKSIQIEVDLPFVPGAEQDQLLEKIRDDFIDLFGNLLGYQNEIHLIAHFQNESHLSPT